MSCICIWFVFYLDKAWARFPDGHTVIFLRVCSTDGSFPSSTILQARRWIRGFRLFISHWDFKRVAASSWANYFLTISFHGYGRTMVWSTYILVTTCLYLALPTQPLQCVSTSRGNISARRGRQLIIVLSGFSQFLSVLIGRQLAAGPHAPYLGTSSPHFWVITVIRVWIKKSEN